MTLAGIALKAACTQQAQRLTVQPYANLPGVNGDYSRRIDFVKDKPMDGPTAQKIWSTPDNTQWDAIAFDTYYQTHKNLRKQS